MSLCYLLVVFVHILSLIAKGEFPTNYNDGTIDASDGITATNEIAQTNIIENDNSNNENSIKNNNNGPKVSGIYRGRFRSVSIDGIENKGHSLLIISDDITSTTHSPSRAMSKLMLLSESTFRRSMFLFFYAKLDPKTGAIQLTNTNTSSSLNVTCPQSLLISLPNASFTNCKYNITLHSFSFVAMPRFVATSNSYSVIALFCVLMSFYYLLRQNEHISSHSNRISSISFVTLYLQFIYNGTICFLHFDLAMNIESLFSTFLVISFVSVMNANIYQRMMTQIWKLRWSSTLNSLKLLNFIKISSLILILYISTHLIFISNLKYILFTFLLSDWLFQIIHNIKCGQLNAWNIPSVCCITLCKLFYPLYIYGFDGNIIQNPTDYTFCLFLLVYPIIQIALLYSQNLKRSPDWFIPSVFKKKKYKYHRTPPSTDDDDDDVDVVGADSEAEHLIIDVKNNNNQEELTCSICLETIDWKKEYSNIMITPCDHYFHDMCLTTWMLQRMTCPTCRATLPHI